MADFYPALIVYRIVTASGIALERGVELLDSVGLPAQPQPNTMATMISPQVVYPMVETLLDETDAGLPIRYGQLVQPEDFGILGLASRTAPTLRAGLQRAVRYIYLISDTVTYELRETEDGGADLILNRSVERRRGEWVLNEAALAGLLAVLRQTMTGTIRPVRAAFQHDALRPGHDLADYFDCSVSFNAERNLLSFSAQMLEQPATLADMGLSNYLESQLESELSQRRGRQSLESQIREVIANSYSDGIPKMQAVAKRLGMSERTMQRRLGEQGLSYHGLIDDERRSLAQRLLKNTQTPILDIAFLTGFSEQSAFQRAFKRWTDQTPLDFRKAATSKTG